LKIVNIDDCTLIGRVLPGKHETYFRVRTVRCFQLKFLPVVCGGDVSAGQRDSRSRRYIGSSSKKEVLKERGEEPRDRWDAQKCCVSFQSSVGSSSASRKFGRVDLGFAFRPQARTSVSPCFLSLSNLFRSKPADVIVDFRSLFRARWLTDSGLREDESGWAKFASLWRATRRSDSP
jgi:hypothetical protein